MRRKLNADQMANEELFGLISRVTVSTGTIQIMLRDAGRNKRPIEIPWEPKPKGQTQIDFAPSETKSDAKLIKAMARAHVWLGQLSDGQHASIEDLAAAASYNPKVIRQGLRLAFLAPDLSAGVLHGDTQIRLRQIPKLLPLSWREQVQAIG